MGTVNGGPTHRPDGKCPHCKKMILLDRDGFIARHKGGNVFFCDGTGARPMPRMIRHEFRPDKNGHVDTCTELEGSADAFGPKMCGLAESSPVHD